jgi:hypothetical protein
VGLLSAAVEAYRTIQATGHETGPLFGGAGDEKKSSLRSVEGLVPRARKKGVRKLLTGMKPLAYRGGLVVGETEDRTVFRFRARVMAVPAGPVDGGRPDVPAVPQLRRLIAHGTRRPGPEPKPGRPREYTWALG